MPMGRPVPTNKEWAWMVVSEGQGGVLEMPLQVEMGRQSKQFSPIG